MDEELKKFLLAFLKKTLGMDDAGVAALFEADGKALKSDAMATLLAKDADRVSKFKTDATEKHDEGYKKAQREIMEKLEKDFKAKYSFESDKKGLELIEDFITKKSKEKNITDEEVKAHPLYVAAKAEVKTAVDNKDAEWKSKYDQRESEIKNQETLSFVLTEGMTELEKLKPILPDDVEIRKNHIAIFKDRISGMKFTTAKNADGTTRIIPMDSEGKERLRDAHGNEIAFTDVIKKTASSYWPFQAAEDRSSEDPNKGAGAGSGGAGAGAGGAGAAKKWKFVKPKDDKEFMSEMAKIDARTDLDKKEKTLAKNELSTLHMSTDGQGK